MIVDELDVEYQKPAPEQPGRSEGEAETEDPAQDASAEGEAEAPAQDASAEGGPVQDDPEAQTPQA